MGSRHWLTTALAITACSEVVIPDDDGEQLDGSGGAPTGSAAQKGSSTGASQTSSTSSAPSSGSTPSPTAASSSGLTAASSSSGHVEPGSECDAGLDGDATSVWCKACQQCSLASVCETQVATCQGNPDCVAFLGCEQECDDCDCAADHPGGAALHDALIDCLECSCVSDCGTNLDCGDRVRSAR